MKDKLHNMTSKKTNFCSVEEAALIECLNKNKENPLVCEEMVNKYTACALSSSP